MFNFYFQDVDCSDVKSVESILQNGTDTTVSDVNPEVSLEKENEKIDDSLIYNLTDTEGNLNISEVTSDETLASSELTKLDPNNTSEVEIKQAFCRDMARVTRSYEVNISLINYFKQKNIQLWSSLQNCVTKKTS